LKTPLRELTSLPRPRALLNGLTSKGREGKGKGKGKGDGKENVEWREWERRWRQGTGPPKNFSVIGLVSLRAIRSFNHS